MGKRLRTLASLLWDGDEDAESLLQAWGNEPSGCSGLGSDYEDSAAKLTQNSEQPSLVPDVAAVQPLPVVVEKPGLRKLIRTRDPWHWVKQLSGDVTSLDRFRNEVVPDLEQTNFAQGEILFNLANSRLSSGVLSHAEVCIRSIFSKNPALYKIGVTRNPVRRWLHSGYGYKLDRHVQWERMIVLHAHCNADVICLLEAALIRIFFNAPGCRNIRLGGEGLDEQSSGCVEALSFATGCAPMLSYLKSQKKKEDDAASKRVKVTVCEFASSAEAPANSVAAHERAMVLQKGVEATREELGGVLGLSEQNSARHVEKVVSAFGLRPPIPLSHHTLRVGTETFVLPYLAPKDVLAQPLEIISLEPTLGIGRDEPKFCKCADPVLQTGQRCNGKYHSYLTRFLLVAFPSKQWPQELLADVWKALSSQLRELLESGLLVHGRRYYFGILGLKADFEFHCTSLRDAGLMRSYEHVGRAKDIPVCMECEAGFPETPMEDANANAAWTKTIGKSAPWQRVPSFAELPFDNWHSFPSRAAEFFRRDPFHVFRLGAFPWLGCKGSDTIVLLKWLRVLVVQLRSRGRSVGTGHDFATCRACAFIEMAVIGGLQFSQGIHGHSLWLGQSCMRFLRKNLFDFLRGYSQLALYCQIRNIPLFGLTPKYHALCHFKHDFEDSLQKNRQTLINPAAFDCSMSEDFIGRVSRQSRRIGFKKDKFEKHLLQHYLLKFSFIVRGYKNGDGQRSGARFKGRCKRKAGGMR
ncbi:unnamed protein product [Symbiodinium microadriaticum]|nr:unnamed protein product [Symbiodinium microadriaticum]